MDKRQMWVMVCVIFAGLWFALGIFVWPLLLFSLCSLLMVFIPIGVPEHRTPKHVHDPEKWAENTKE